MAFKIINTLILFVLAAVFAASSSISVTLAHAQGGATYVTLTAAGKDAAGHYKYTVKGYLKHGDFNQDSVGTGYDYYLQLGTNGSIGRYNIYNDYYGHVDASGGFAMDFTFTDTDNKLTGSQKVDLWADGWSFDDWQLFDSTVDFNAIRATSDSYPDTGRPPDTSHDGSGDTPVDNEADAATPLGGPTSVSLTCGSITMLNTSMNIDDFIKCIGSFGGNLNRLLIGIGVIASIFILPWIGVLYASGSATNIEKANDILFSWFSGLALLLLSGAIILIIGHDLFGVS